MAAYANASLAFALDYEDVVCYCIHTGLVTIPAALAIGELHGASGREFLIAIERGYEIGTRIGLAMQPSCGHKFGASNIRRSPRVSQWVACSGSMPNEWTRRWVSRALMRRFRPPINTSARLQRLDRCVKRNSTGSECL